MLRDAFRQAYQLLADQVPASTVEWPLLPTVAFLHGPTERRPRGVTVAVSVLLLGAAFFGGWFLAPDSAWTATDRFTARDVVVFAAETTVDLRLEVRTDGFCHWFGVVGRVEAGALVWRGGPALGCDR